MLFLIHTLQITDQILLFLLKVGAFFSGNTDGTLSMSQQHSPAGRNCYGVFKISCNYPYMALTEDWSCWRMQPNQQRLQYLTDSSSFAQKF